MKYKLKVYSIWEYGQRKDSQGNPHQEDNMFPESGKQSDDDRLFILCDGMGGHDAGEVASATVCEAMSRSVLDGGRDKDGIFTSEDFSNALDAAFDSLDKKDSGAAKKMGTTMTFLKLHEKGAFIAHMGDSRVYQIRPGKTGEDTRIVFQTEDHSLVNDLVKIGELTKEEARFSKQKNVITRAMQPNMERRCKADIHETGDIKAGDYFYMCSDGMLEQPEMESGESLKNIFSEMGGPDKNKVEILKSVTEKNRDNHTAFIIHILEVENPMEAPVKENTTADDKFVAIVEEEDLEKNDSRSEIDTTEEARNRMVSGNPDELSVPRSADIVKRETVQSMPEPLTKKEGKKKDALHKESLSADVKRYIIVAAIAVLVFIVGLNVFRSCSKDNDDNRKKKTEWSSRKTSSQSGLRHKLPGNESEVSPDITPTESSPPIVVDAANSPAASEPETSVQSPQDPISGIGSIRFALQGEQGEGIVKSDQQAIQDMNK